MHIFLTRISHPADKSAPLAAKKGFLNIYHFFASENEINIFLQSVNIISISVLIGIEIVENKQKMGKDPNESGSAKTGYIPFSKPGYAPESRVLKNKFGRASLYLFVDIYVSVCVRACLCGFMWRACV